MDVKIILSPKQKEIVNQDGLFVVRACPGSGKTFSVAARIACWINDPHRDFSHQGFAAISFTNVAADEIQQTLQNDFGVAAPLKYPHFIGTIDRFINKYIFLPYGHLIMECEERPELVGEPYSFWYDYDPKLRRYHMNKCVKRDAREYFDKVSFDKDDEPVPLYRPDYFPRSWKNIRNQNGKYRKDIEEMVDAKWLIFREARATQADANYVAYKILLKYKKIAKNIVNRFSHLIVDEAQDTNDIQIAIINVLVESGLREICLIGDPHQAIFEWNDAKPELFLEKYNNWPHIDFNENRRSSKLICNSTQHLLSIAAYDVISKDRDYDFKPVVFGHNENKDSVWKALESFQKICKERKIEMTPENVAVLYRSHSTGEWLGIPKPDENKNPWVSGHYYARDIALGKYLIENGELKKGFQTIERGCHKALNKDLRHCSSGYIKEEIEKLGFKNYRDKVFKFIDAIPSTKGKTLKRWVNESNASFSNGGYQVNISVNQNNANIEFDSLFKITRETKDLNYFIGTIHSAKGKTFEAVLLVLRDKAGSSKYKNILFPPNNKSLSSGQWEELRNIYVAITRPKKILVIAVPRSDCDDWKKKLLLN